MPKFMLEGPRPRTIFCFAFMYELPAQPKRLYWLVPGSVVNN